MRAQSVVAEPHASQAAGGLLFTMAAACVVRSWVPETWAGTTWEAGSAAFAAFYLSLLGVGLVQHSEPARRFVILAAVLVTLVCTLALGTASPRGRLLAAALATLAIGLGWLLAGPPASPRRTILCTTLAAAGLVAALPAEVLVAREPRDEARRKLSEWSLPERSYADADAGVALQLPAGWVLLKQGSPFTPIPGTAIDLVHDPSQARVALHVDRDVRDLDDLDAYLDRHLARWRRIAPQLEDRGRTAERLAAKPARRVNVTWTDGERVFTGYAMAWRDSSTFLAWSGWCPAKAAEPGCPELERVQGALAITFPLTDAMAKATAALATEMPQISPATVAAVLSRRPWLVKAPRAAIFREVLVALSHGVAALSLDQARELGDVNRALYDGVPAGDRERLAAYMDRVQRLQPTTAAEDSWAMRATGAAVERLAEGRRARLRAILDLAAIAGMGSRREVATEDSADPVDFAPTTPDG